MINNMFEYKEYDYILIGAGVVADAISKTIINKAKEAQKEIPSILILEAGDRIKTRDSALFHNMIVENKLPEDKNEIYDAYYDLNYKSSAETIGENINSYEGNQEIPLYGSRIFAYGGATHHWGGWSFRLKPEDFKLYSLSKKKIDELKNSDTPEVPIPEEPRSIDWPYGYDKLAPYYKKAEHFLGVSGNDQDPYFAITYDICEKKVMSNVKPLDPLNTELDELIKSSRIKFSEFFTNNLKSSKVDELLEVIKKECPEIYDCVKKLTLDDKELTGYSVQLLTELVLVYIYSLEYPYKEFPFTKEDGIFINAFEDDKQKISYSNLPIARYSVPKNKMQEEKNHGSHHAPCQTTGTCKYCPFGARYNAANGLDELLEMDCENKVTITHNAVVNRIIFNDKTNKGTAVEYYNRKTKKIVTPKINKLGKIIVCAGAIESTKLLLRSTSKKYKNGLGNNQDLVGKYLITHPYFIFKATLPSSVNKDFKYQPQKGFPTLISRHFDNKENQLLGKFTLINPIRTPELKLNKLMHQGNDRAAINKIIEGDTIISIEGIVEIFSERKNTIKQTDKRNRFGLLETEIKYTKDNFFDYQMEVIKNKVSEIFKSAGASFDGKVNNLSWRADHAACTTRMAKSAKDGVVDENLKIFDTENIYVCSNSSLPTIGAVNPTLTLTAVAIKLAEHLTKN